MKNVRTLDTKSPNKLFPTLFSIVNTPSLYFLLQIIILSSFFYITKIKNLISNVLLLTWEKIILGSMLMEMLRLIQIHRSTHFKTLLNL